MDKDKKIQLCIEFGINCMQSGLSVRETLLEIYDKHKDLDHNDNLTITTTLAAYELLTDMGYKITK
ncbi:hypothetical protein [Priestia megaterium]|uniref:hypothetical protein n=1 Tax=Priestia megaterium TaxID=1404 RepID=UPI0027AB01CA|nr:hypothetical protein [Priestia megaterium]WDC90824.1 hypothetical protein PSR56_12520 [Priestia megaterium]